MWSEEHPQIGESYDSWVPPQPTNTTQGLPPPSCYGSPYSRALYTLHLLLRAYLSRQRARRSRTKFFHSLRRIKILHLRIGSFPASEPASNSIRRLPQFGCMTKHESLQATSFLAFNLYSDSKKVFTSSKRPAKKKTFIRVSTNTRVYCTLIVHGS